MIAIIGDIHGCFYTLKELVQKIRTKYPGITIYSTGDIVDRGKFSFETVEFIKNEKIIFVPGNHDYMFYYYFHFPTSVIARTWLYNGNEATLESYSKHKDKLEEHLNFLIRSPLYINLEHSFISHAGISKHYKRKLPKNPLGNIDLISKIALESIENGYGILWNRDELLDLGKLQIVGHTRHVEVTYNKHNNTVYIDTSVYTGNRLSSIIVEDNRVEDIISVRTFPIDLGN